MRTFQGAFHANPDYVQWYGWGPLKETAVRIQAEDERLRAEAATPESSVEESPGFGAIIGIAALLGLVLYLRRRG